MFSHRLSSSRHQKVLKHPTLQLGALVPNYKVLFIFHQKLMQTFISFTLFCPFADINIQVFHHFQVLNANKCALLEHLAFPLMYCISLQLPSLLTCPSEIFQIETHFSYY